MAFGMMPDRGEIYAVSEQGVVREFDISEVELMQFTGLLDKHGKEVYEGDKLKSEMWCNEGNGSWDVVINEVVFRYGAFGLRLHDDRFLPLCDEDISEDIILHPFELVGNIYENPNLINQ